MVGGLGTRLGGLTRHRPKPLLPVGGRPFLHWLVDELRRQQVERVLLLAGFAGDQVIADLGAEPGITVVVEPRPLGTGGALRFAEAALDNRFLLLNGDSLFDINLWDLTLQAETATATMALRRLADVGRYGAATLVGDRVTGFRSAGGAGPGVINGGVVALSREVLSLIEPGRPVSIEAEVYPRLAAEGRLRGIVYDRPFLDIGVPEDYARSQSWVGGTLRRGAVIFDRDGVLSLDVGYTHPPVQIEWIEGAIAAVKAVNDAGLFAFVATNQVGALPGYYEEADVQALHRRMNSELMARGAHVDAFAYSPYHPDGVVGAYRGHAPRLEPNPGTLLDLLSRFPVDPARTLMVGDRPSDLVAAGVEGLLFEGGDLLERVSPSITRLRRG